MKALVTYSYPDEKIERISELGYNVIIGNEKDISWNENYRDVDVLVCNNPFGGLDIDRLEQLKWIQLISMGTDRVPLEKVEANGITLTNARGGFSIAIAEWLISKVFEVYKKTRFYYDNQRNKVWEKDRDILELSGKKVLFFGTGSIARETAARLKAFGCEVYGVNTDGRELENFERCVEFAEVDSLISDMDINIITLPLTDRTESLIDYKVMSEMDEDSVLVNVSRGSVVVEDDLVELLNESYFKAVILDVFEEEPLPPDSPLWSMDNVIISPHVSYASEFRFDRVFDIIYENMERYINGEDLMNVVDIEKGY